MLFDLKKKFSFKTFDTKYEINFFGLRITKKRVKDVKKNTKKINKLLKQISKKIKRNQKIKVYFLVYDKSQWTFQSLYDAMEKDDLFEPYVLVFPAWVRDIDKNANLDLINFVKNLNLRYVTKLDEGNLPDILFTTMPVYEQKHVPLDIPSLYDKILFCFHIYGWLLTDDDIVYYANDNFKYFWKEYVPSQRDYIAACKKGPLNGSNVVCSGYLKNDCFYKANKESKLWKNKDTKKIIWAPHYSLYEGGHSLATFDLYFDKMLNYLKIHPEIEIILKPHPLLRKMIGDKEFQEKIFRTNIDFLTLDEYDEYIQNWNNLPNGTVMDSGNYYELFNSSDAIILDSESFVAEYMIQDKPMCFCNKYSSIESIKSFMNTMGKDLFDAMTVAQCWNDIEKFIENVINNVDNMKVTREKMIGKYLNINKNKVGETIKEDIKSSLI